MDKKSVTYPNSKKRKFNFRLASVALKLLLSFLSSVLASVRISRSLCDWILCTIDRFHCHAVKKINRKPFSGKSQEIVILLKIKKTLLQVLGLCVLPNRRYSAKCFAEIYRAKYGNAMLVHIRCAPTWRPENSVNIWNLHWLFRRLTLCT